MAASGEVADYNQHMVAVKLEKHERPSLELVFGWFVLDYCRNMEVR